MYSNPMQGFLIELTKQFVDSIDVNRLNDPKYRKEVAEMAGPFAGMWNSEVERVEKQAPLLARVFNK